MQYDGLATILKWECFYFGEVDLSELYDFLFQYLINYL